MKVDSLNYSQAYKSKHGSVYDLHKRENYGGLCDEKKCEKLNKGYYRSGSSLSFGSAAKYSDRLLKNLIDGCNNHTVIIQNLWALMLAVLPRPIAIMLIPDPKRKNQKDKMAAATHGIASGLVGFGFASAIMYPLGKAAKKVKKDGEIVSDRLKGLTDEALETANITKKQLLEGTKFVGEKFLDLFGDFDKNGKLIKLNKALNFDRVTKALDMSPDTFVFGIAKAMLTIALIPPIMKYLFGEGKQKPQPALQTANVEGGQK